jgi:hypothetical protein
MVFSAQSQRHVAEQIEALYWNQVTADEDRAEIDTVVVRRDADLTETATIENLPEDYADLHLHPDHVPQDEEATGYKELRDRLLELSQERDALKKRVAQYQQLQKLLDPLQDSVANIQPNLVTRDGELSQELDRMRVLLARVSARLADMGSRPVSKDLGQSSTRPPTNTQKLARLMEIT